MGSISVSWIHQQKHEHMWRRRFRLLIKNEFFLFYFIWNIWKKCATGVGEEHGSTPFQWGTAKLPTHKACDDAAENPLSLPNLFFQTHYFPFLFLPPSQWDLFSVSSSPIQTTSPRPLFANLSSLHFDGIPPPSISFMFTTVLTI